MGFPTPFSSRVQEGNRMANLCDCEKTQETLPAVSTVDMQQLTHFHTTSQKALGTAFPAAAAAFAAASQYGAIAQAPTEQLHLTPEGGTLVSTSHASANQGQVVLVGSIGALPYELHLTVKLEDKVITVTLELKKPIPLGPFTWTYRLGGAVTGPQGQFLAVSTVAPQDLTLSAAPQAAGGLNWWCVVKCGGTSILGLLIKCLPSLITGGSSGFIACVTAGAGTAAASIAACLAQKCFH
jgi:hypothetical protein